MPEPGTSGPDQAWSGSLEKVKSVVELNGTSEGTRDGSI